MARLQRDLIRLQTNHLGQNAIALMKRAFYINDTQRGLKQEEYV
jgi:hypothetical protein